MKRSWIGLAILLALLTVGLLTSWAIARTHEPIAQSLEQAGRVAMAGDWAQAQSLADRARSQWEKWQILRDFLSDQSPVEEIGASLAELEIYLAAKDDVHFAATCAQLAFQIAAVGNAHAIAFGNLL